MNDSIYVLILIVLGLFIATLTARSANNRKATRSGSLANAFNFLASGVVAMIAPTALCSILFIHPNFLGEVRLFSVNVTVFAHVLVIVLVMIAVALVLLLPYAMLEKPYLDRMAQQEDKGWTREDAETSGL